MAWTKQEQTETQRWSGQSWQVEHGTGCGVRSPRALDDPQACTRGSSRGRGLENIGKEVPEAHPQLRLCLSRVPVTCKLLNPSHFCSS